MSSNGKSMVPGASKSEKPKGAAANSFPDTTKPIAAPSVSSDLSIGAPPPLSKKDKVDSSDSSSRLTKPSSKTGVASGVSIGRPNPKTSTDEKCLQVSIQRQPDNVDLQSLLEAQLIILVALKIAGRLHETALDAATKGNRYIHSCLRERNKYHA
ncbi:Uncharacterized protein Rs2_40263 [Raphanus sativus]|nr:Uncharacterized protein Rs2_40263 [Raphanus sativus]